MKTILVLLLLLTGCAARPHTQREQWLLGGMVTAQLADGYTTSRYIKIGGTELNPMLSKRPDDDSIYLFKAGVIGILYGFGELFPDYRENFYWFGIVSGGGAAVWNNRLYERYK